jgi:hypothetical protein
MIIIFMYEVQSQDTICEKEILTGKFNFNYILNFHYYNIHSLICILTSYYLDENCIFLTVQHLLEPINYRKNSKLSN